MNKLNNQKVSQHEAQMLSKNLHQLMTHHHVTISQLAQALALPIMTIRRLLSGDTLDPRISTLKLIANYFDVTLDALIEQNLPLGAKQAKKTKPRFVPLLEWGMVEQVHSIAELDLSRWKEWQPIPNNLNDTLGKQAFALQSRPSFYPRYPAGTLFIFDPDLTPNDGDLVLVKIKKNKELTLRKLSIDPPEWQLRSIVAESAHLTYLAALHKIVAINFMTLFYHRK